MPSSPAGVQESQFSLNIRGAPAVGHSPLGENGLPPIGYVLIIGAGPFEWVGRGYGGSGRRGRQEADPGAGRG